MSLRIFLVLLIAITYLHLTSFSQSIPTDKLDEIVEGKIDSIAPGVAVGIIKDGKILYEKYSGYANLEHQIKVDEKTRFNIASVAKQFTALSILELSQKGKLQLTEDFRTYLPEYFPEIKASITIAQLLTHTSGIRDFYDLMSMQGNPWWAETGFDNKDALQILSTQKTLNFAPGTDYTYSNSGYLLLTAIVEKISSKSFSEYTADLFTRLQMSATHFVTNYMAVIPQKALPYTNWGDGQWQQYPYVVNLHGDGFLFTTLQDQLNYERNIQRTYPGMDPGRELSESLKKLLASSQKPIAAAPIEHYGFGLELDQYRGLKRIQHAGGTGSYGAQILRFPEKSLTVVVMSNNGNVWSGGLANELVDLLFAELPISLPDINTGAEPADAGIPEDLGSYTAPSLLAGNYRSEDDGLIEIKANDQELVWQVLNQNPINLIHQAGNLYSSRQNPKMQVLFDSAAQTFTVYYPGSIPRVHQRVIAPTLDKAALEAVNGTYYNDEIDVAFELNFQEADKYTMKIRDRTFDATLKTNDRIRMGDYILHLSRKDGKVHEIRVDHWRNKNIQFVRQ